MKLNVTRQGNLVVTERGTGASDGRLSIVDRPGNVRPLLDGLPSDIEVTGQPSGPSGVQVRGCCVVELTIGEGNGLRFDPVTGPPLLIPNPEGISSPIFSSVLRLIFDTPLDRLNGSFTLAPEW